MSAATAVGLLDEIVAAPFLVALDRLAIRFGGGEFHFGYVHGHMDCKPTTREGEPAVEWTWDGNDEIDTAQGRGWAVAKGDELHGMIFFHGGDDSEFVAKRATQKKATKGK